MSTVNVQLPESTNSVDVKDLLEGVDLRARLNELSKREKQVRARLDDETATCTKELESITSERLAIRKELEGLVKTLRVETPTRRGRKPGQKPEKAARNSTRRQSVRPSTRKPNVKVTLKKPGRPPKQTSA